MFYQPCFYFCKISIRPTYRQVILKRQHLHSVQAFLLICSLGQARSNNRYSEFPKLEIDQECQINRNRLIMTKHVSAYFISL